MGADALAGACADEARGTAACGPPVDGDWARMNSSNSGNLCSADFNGMLAPLWSMRFAALAWFQGESNLDTSRARAAGANYACRSPRALAGWRDAFDAPALPFVYVEPPRATRTRASSSPRAGRRCARRSARRRAAGRELRDRPTSATRARACTPRSRSRSAGASRPAAPARVPATRSAPTGRRSRARPRAATTALALAFEDKSCADAPLSGCTRPP